MLLLDTLKTDCIELDLLRDRVGGDRRLLQPISVPPKSISRGRVWPAQSSHRIHPNNTEIKMAKPDPYADIDFEEINDATNLAPDEIKCLKV